MRTLNTPHILLADDDKDDCLLFTEALKELPVSAELTIVYDGEYLMQLLHKLNGELPDILFLDLNMPRKNGSACLSAIKQNSKLKDLPVIILSTSFDHDVVNLLYKNGAHHYFRKPNEFSQLKNLINRAIKLAIQSNFAQPHKDKFVLSTESYYL